MNLILYIFNVTILHTHLYIYIYTHTHTHTHTHPYGSAAQHGPWPPFLVRFLDHTRWRTTVGRTSLDEWWALCRDLYVTTDNTYNRQTSMPLAGFEPTISGGGQPQTYALDHAATGTSTYIYIYIYIYIINTKLLHSVLSNYVPTYFGLSSWPSSGSAKVWLCSLYVDLIGHII